MAEGILDQLGNEIFTTGKVREALDALFAEKPSPFIRLVQKTMADTTVPPSQIGDALRRIWDSEIAQMACRPTVRPLGSRPAQLRARLCFEYLVYMETEKKWMNF